MKYKGPCIDCGEYKDQQYTYKRCIACYQKFHRYSPEFQPRQKYQGPCIFCGTHESREGRFIRKMCSNCYSRFKTKGTANYKIIEKYPGPCIICGSDNPGYASYFQEKMCGKCYRRYSHRRDNPKKVKNCIDCGKRLENKTRNTYRDRCSACYRNWKRKTDPIYYQNLGRQNPRWHRLKDWMQ